MASSNLPVCITCGLPTLTPPQLNRLPNGQVCPACRDRLLDWLPAPLPCREPAGEVDEPNQHASLRGADDVPDVPA